MQQTRVDDEKTSARVSLRIGNSLRDAWSEVIRPWFSSAALAAPTAEGLVAVVTPFRSHAHFLRNQLLAEGTSLLGVRFLFPAQLREILLRQTGPRVPLREHLRLLLAISAEEFARRAKSAGDNNDGSVMTAKSVARDPDHFLRAIDQFNASGWSIDDLQPKALREIAKSFAARVHSCGFEFVHVADGEALTKAYKPPRLFSNLLVTGFDGAHWPQWPLLRAAVTTAANATVVLNDPRDEARDLDEAWVGTWEETFGAAEPIGAGNAEPAISIGDRLRLSETDSVRTARMDQPLTNVHFLIGRDATEQARAIVALAARFLGDSTCERIGILFPGSGALPRLVARFLESARIAHNDGIGHLAPSAFDTEAWRMWLELQQNPRLRVLLQFLRAAGSDVIERVPISQIEDALKNAYRSVLLDQIDILHEYCRRQADSEENADVAILLDKIKFLPATGTLAGFLEETRKALTSLGWRQYWSEVDRISRNWSKNISTPFAKSHYLRWLREVLATPTVTRDDYGAHPYSRVHLLPYAQAEGQCWSHLIFAGLNEEAWPVGDDAFVREQDIAGFNQRNRKLNRRALKPGCHGEGHWSVQEDKTLYLGAAERREIRRRQLMNLLDSVSAGVGATANLYSDSFPSRIANPSEFFSRLHFNARGRGVSERTLHALEAETRSWLKDWSPVDAQKVDSISVGRTRYAFDARRHLRSAGEYEFALRAPPLHPITLRVTEWEQALRSPALTWMKIFLGVEGEEESANAWPVATGQWVHQWLAGSAHGAGMSTFVEISSVDQIRIGIVRLARDFQVEVQNLSKTCGKALPDWWISGWSNALYIADCLAAKLSDLNDWSQLAVEWPLPQPAEISLDDAEKLRFRGRIDLILARGEAGNTRMPYPDLWVIDYKTGKQHGFNLYELRGNEPTEQKFRRQLIKGKGVQLALYGLAVRAFGAVDARLTVLGTQDELRENFRLADAVAQKDFWQELHRMQETGVFGMIGQIHSEFGFSRDYPLATLAIDPDLLEEKWKLTHPAFAPERQQLNK
jgi:hypothetical protein